MSKKKRKVPALNGSSSADIAFMLLLFFLLTTSMDTDQGLARRLPPPPDPNQIIDQKVNKRNTLLVVIDATNRIMCGGEEVNLKQLREKTKEFIENPGNSEHLPEKLPKEVQYIGTVMCTAEKHVVSLQCDRGTKYQSYLDVQNELAAAYNELRDDLSKSKFGKKFNELSDDEMNAVKEVYPQKISEAEPKTYGETKNKK